MDNTGKAIVTNDIKIDVYYLDEESFEKRWPLEVVMRFPDYMEREPVYFSDVLISCFDVRDTTEDYESNKDIPFDEHKLRTASIDVYGVVETHIGEPVE